MPRRIDGAFFVQPERGCVRLSNLNFDRSMVAPMFVGGDWFRQDSVAVRKQAEVSSPRKTGVQAFVIGETNYALAA